MCESDHRLAEADLRFRNGKHVEAEQLLDAVLDDDPGCPGAYARRGRIAVDRGAFGDAETQLRKAIKAAPTFDASWHAWLGDAYLGLGRPMDAVVAYEAALALSPSDADLGLGLADALLLVQRYADAVDVARDVAGWDEEAIRIGELGSCNAWCLVGEGLAGQGEHVGAIAAFQRATAIYRSHPRAWAGLALSAEAAGQREQAIDAWGIYVALDCCSERSKSLAQPRLDTLRHSRRRP